MGLFDVIFLALNIQLLIKIFDRLHNLQNIHFLTADKQIKVAKETLNTVLLAATYLEDINIDRSFALEEKMLD